MDYPIRGKARRRFESARRTRNLRTLRTGGEKKKNKEMTKKTKILVPHGVVSQMERERYGSRPTIRKALRHDYNEQNDEERNRALRIRRRAMQLGGVAEQNAKEE